MCRGGLGYRAVISLGIWGVGRLIFTLLAKVAIPIELGDLKRPGPGPTPILDPS
jgi:hypothetical protein